MWRLKQIEARRVLVGILRLSFSRSEACALHMTGMRKVSTGWRQLCLTSISWVRPSRKTPVRHFVLPIYPHYPQMLSSASERKPWPNTLRVRDYHTHISLHICLWISSTSTSPFPYHWEVDNPNTYHTLSECQVRFWCSWEALEEAKDGRCNMELVMGFGELDKTRFWETLLK